MEHESFVASVAHGVEIAAVVLLLLGRALEAGR